MNNGLILCLVTAIGFGAWPLIARWSGANDAWVTVIVMTVTTLVGALALVSRLPAMPSARSIGILAVAGVFNGVGMIAYGKLVAGTDHEISSLPAVSLIMMIAVIYVGGIALFHEQITTQKVIGIIFAGIGVWFMAK